MTVITVALPRPEKRTRPATRTILDGEPYGNPSVAGQCTTVGGRVRIPLTQGQFATIDPADYDLASGYLWCALKGPNTFYAKTDVRKERGRTTLLLHTLLTGYKRVDHVDLNGLHCWELNMREATRSQNAINRRKLAGCSSRYLGVSWNKRSGKWQAHIRIQGVWTCIGCFTEEVEAALAFDAAARTHHGAFGRYNFPLPGEQPALTAADSGVAS
jgi:hypothetical protein